MKKAVCLPFAYSRILLGILLLPLLTSAQEQTYEMETPLHSDSVINSYRLGFIQGKARGSMRRLYPINCLAGCILGAGGSAIGFIVANEMDADAKWIVGISTMGGLASGSLIIFSELKNKKIPCDSVITDSFYLQGYRDGYLCASKPNKIIDTAGGCMIGTALVTGYILHDFCIF
jgi:hypothetical protein